MLSIDEAIAHAREVVENNRKTAEECLIFNQFQKADECVMCAEEHEQLAEWLEELKAYREIGTVEECKNSVLDIQKAYNKAIDDCKELTFREVVYCDSLNDRTEFRELAEELKEKNR